MLNVRFRVLSTATIQFESYKSFQRGAIIIKFNHQFTFDYKSSVWIFRTHIGKYIIYIYSKIATFESFYPQATLHCWSGSKTFRASAIVAKRVSNSLYPNIWFRLDTWYHKILKYLKLGSVYENFFSKRTLFRILFNWSRLFLLCFIVFWNDQQFESLTCLF